MGAYNLSTECEIDISEIYEYGIDQFGLIQSQEYMIGLHDLFETLAENTNIGRGASEFYPYLAICLQITHDFLSTNGIWNFHCENPKSKHGL